MAKELGVLGLHTDSLLSLRCVSVTLGNTEVGDLLCAARVAAWSALSCLPAPGSLPLTQDLLRSCSFREVFLNFSSHSPLRPQRKVSAENTPPAPHIYPGSPFHHVIVSLCNLFLPVLLLHFKLHERHCVCLVPFC